MKLKELLSSPLRIENEKLACAFNLPSHRHSSTHSGLSYNRGSNSDMPDPFLCTFVMRTNTGVVEKI